MKLNVNVPNLRKTLEMMASKPHLVDMGVWVSRTPCRTTACMAGWAAALAGDWIMQGNGASRVKVGNLDRAIEVVAAEVLGFETWDLANSFFMRPAGWQGRKAVAVLYKMAEVITEGDIVMPPEFDGDYRMVTSRLGRGDPARWYLYDDDTSTGVNWSTP